MKQPMYRKAIVRKLGMAVALAGVCLLNACTLDLSIELPSPPPTRLVVRGVVTATAIGRPVEGIQMGGVSGMLSYIDWWKKHLRACIPDMPLVGPSRGLTARKDALPADARFGLSPFVPGIRADHAP